FAYLREELGYSEASADRRIKAMRLIKDLPEVEEKIATGSLSLSVASTVQRFLQKENRKRREEKALPFTKSTKLELVNSLEGRSLRDCEKKLAEISPETALPRDRTRIIAEDKVHIAFTASQSLLKKIERLKLLTCHQNPQGQYETLFEKAMDLALDKLDPERKLTPAPESKTKNPVGEKSDLLKKNGSENRNRNEHGNGGGSENWNEVKNKNGNHGAHRNFVTGIFPRKSAGRFGSGTKVAVNIGIP
ncbi:MAG: hypothetical protein KDD43_17240, partial [Bdellovibrionales bacterium]|nr:hypothetical protein [Bdellovibrionales bacterium]